MKAISVRAPWWWFILHAGKDIENRDWWTGFRGTVLVHASKWFRADEVSEDWQYGIQMHEEDGGLLIDSTLPRITMNQMKGLGGHIVGSVEIVDCVKKSDSPWFQGKYGFVLRNPVAFDKPYPVKGALGFFDAPEQAQTSKGRDPVGTLPKQRVHSKEGAEP